MNAARFMIGGISALAVGAVLVALSFTAPRGAAGQQVACDYTPVGQINALQAVPTCTAVRIVRSATPTFTATVLPSETPVPPTQIPATVAPPTATATPSGGSGGQAVVPPNTGSGPGAGSSVSMELLLAGTVLAVLGSGSVLAAARKRR